MPFLLLWATSWLLARVGANGRRRREARLAWQRGTAVCLGVKCKCYSLKVAYHKLLPRLPSPNFILPSALLSSRFTIGHSAHSAATALSFLLFFCLCIVAVHIYKQYFKQNIFSPISSSDVAATCNRHKHFKTVIFNMLTLRCL